MEHPQRVQELGNLDLSGNQGSRGSSSGSVRRSSRIGALPTVTYSENRIPKKKLVNNVETVIKESNPAATKKSNKILLYDDGKDKDLVRTPLKRLVDNVETVIKESNSAATKKSKQIVLYDDDMDEDLSDEVDKLCKVIMDYIFPPRPWEVGMPYYIKRPGRDTQVSCSRFLAFSQQYKSKFDKFMERFVRVGIYPKEDVLPDYPARACPIAKLDNEDVLKRYKNFKRFDTVKDYSDHLFSAKPMEQRTAGWAERMMKEWKNLEEKLPETISVRVYEERMDLLRAVIVGPKGTPYHDGLFFFDVYFPSFFPFHLPVVRHHSGGYGINPHMFECGEVRLSLFREDFLPSRKLWQSFKTTVLELLVSIQDRVLNADPLFNQPVSLDFGSSVVTEYFSLLYNEDVLIKSLKTMMHVMNRPPKHFEAYVAGHFRNRLPDILSACKAYRDGLQVGGRVGNKDSCCSIEFRNNVDSCILQLKDCFERVIPPDEIALNDKGKKRNSQYQWAFPFTHGGKEVI